MFQNLFNLIFLAIFLPACASIHPGSYGKNIGYTEPLSIRLSAETIDASKNSAFQLIEVTFENLDEHWLRINQVEVDVGDPNQSHLSVVFGKDLQDWAKATQFQQSLSLHNSQMLHLGLLAAGTIAIVAGASNNNENLVKAGLVSNIATHTYNAVEEINKSVKNAEQSEKIDTNHLYAPFSVPGKMFMRRWVLLNKPVGAMVNKLVLSIETVEGEKSKYEVKL